MTNLPDNNLYNENEIDLLSILVVLVKSWRLLVFGPLLAGALASFLSFLWPKTFESVAIVRLAEEELALLHAPPVLNSLIDNFGYLKDANGIKEDARKSLMRDLVFFNDKKTKLSTVVAKGHTPESAQALGKAAIQALLLELQPKGQDKEAILQRIKINNQLISEGVLQLRRRNPSENGVIVQIADLRVNNLELLMKLQGKGQEIFVEEFSLTERKVAPKIGLVVLITVMTAGVAILLFLFACEAWRGAETHPKNAVNIKILREILKGKY